MIKTGAIVEIDTNLKKITGIYILSRNDVEEEAIKLVLKQITKPSPWARIKRMLKGDFKNG